MIYIDLETGGFYNDEVHSVIPETAKEITEEAYNWFLDNNGQYEIDREKFLEIDIVTIDVFQKIEHGMEQLRLSRLQEINTTCQNVIYGGVDVETSEGLKHFSLTEPDQINLTGMAAQLEKALLGQPSNVDINKGVAYHADGELCRFWSPEDFAKIAYAATSFVFYQQTYCNHLRQYVKNISGYEELTAVNYGMELPAELQAGMNELLGVDSL